MTSMSVGRRRGRSALSHRARDRRQRTHAILAPRTDAHALLLSSRDPPMQVPRWQIAVLDLSEASMSLPTAPQFAAFMLVVGAFGMGACINKQLGKKIALHCCLSDAFSILHTRRCVKIHAGWLAMWRLVLSKSNTVRAICGLPLMPPPQQKKA